MVAGEPLRRVGAPTPRLLRSPPLAKVQSHSHHLLRQVLFAYLAVPPCLVEHVYVECVWTYVTLEPLSMISRPVLGFGW